MTWLHLTTRSPSGSFCGTLPVPEAAAVHLKNVAGCGGWVARHQPVDYRESLSESDIKRVVAFWGFIFLF
ncbi:hypothetical protein MAY76_10830 [Edwardsiella ictaluri]|nr:hypothetical protein [Edwardsiella ictaluri]WFO08867.1 hypothetical protein MAY76_10830 [Edwardsiella ictaluri]